MNERSRLVLFVETMFLCLSRSRGVCSSQLGNNGNPDVLARVHNERRIRYAFRIPTTVVLRGVRLDTTRSDNISWLRVQYMRSVKNRLGCL